MEKTLKVMIIIDLGQRQKPASNAENITDLPEILQVPLYVVFHTLESHNAGLVDVKKDNFKKRSKGILCSKI